MVYFLIHFSSMNSPIIALALVLSISVGLSSIHFLVTHHSPPLCNQITIQDFAAGSLIVDVRFSGLEDKSASAALATRLALECATLLDAHVFGKVKVLRGEIKELVEEADGGDEEADWTDDEDEDFHIDTESEVLGFDLHLVVVFLFLHARPI